MCPKAVIACCDTEARGEVVRYGKEGGLKIERSPYGCYATGEGDADYEGDIEPVHEFIPI